MALLQIVLGADSSSVQAVEIADSEELMERYGIRIPVLACEDAAGRKRELGWPFDAAMLQDFLADAAAGEEERAQT